MNTNIDERTEALARRMYDVYTAAVGGKAWDGRPLPSSAEFFADESKKKQANGWRAAAEQCKSVELMPGSFGWALEWMKKGKGARLPHWKEDVVIRCQFPDEHSKMTAPYLYVESRNGRVPWKETMIELFAENWEIVD